MNTESDTNGKNTVRDALGRFGAGNPGRPPGTSRNKQLRDEIKTFIGDSWTEFPTWFKELKPKEKCEVILALLPFAVPRLQGVALTDTEGNDQPSEPVIDYSKLSDATLREILAAVEDEKAN